MLPLQTFFERPKQMEVRRCQGEYARCEIAVQSKELMTPRVLRLVSGLALSCCNKTLNISKAGQTFRILALNFFNVSMQTFKLMVAPLDMKSTSITT